MFGPHGTYRMVPISLAVGLVLPLPFWVAVSNAYRHIINNQLNNLAAQILAQGRFRELQHLSHHAGLCTRFSCVVVDLMNGRSTPVISLSESTPLLSASPMAS